VPDKHVLLADMRPDNANAAAEVLGNAGYEVSVATVDASSRAPFMRYAEFESACILAVVGRVQRCQPRSLPIRNSLQ
jgi:CheY-like chemotaxis protein